MMNANSNIDSTKIREIFHNDLKKPSISKDDQNLVTDEELEQENENYGIDYDGNTNNKNDMSPNDYDEAFPGFSQEERKLLINKIIEKKKRNRDKLLRQQQRKRNFVDSADTNSESTVEDEENFEDDDDNVDNDYHNNGQYEYQGEESGQEYEHETWENNITNKNKLNKTPTSARSYQTTSSIFTNNHSINTTTKSHTTSQSQHKYTNKSNFESPNIPIQQQMKDCTFSPRIKKLPSHYNSATRAYENIPFYDRVTKWQKDKDKDVLKKKKETQIIDVSDCTFHPKINRNSEKVINMIRKSSMSTSSAGAASAGAGASHIVTPYNVPYKLYPNTNERLFKSNEISLEQRAKFIEDELLRERKEEELECTFQPHIIANQHGKYSEIQPKYDQIINKKEKDRQLQESVGKNMRKEETFTPKVSSPSSKMKSAQKYLHTNIIERLTKPMSIEMVTRNMEMHSGSQTRARSRSAQSAGDSTGHRYYTRSMSVNNIMDTSALTANNLHQNDLSHYERGRRRSQRFADRYSNATNPTNTATAATGGGGGSDTGSHFNDISLDSKRSVSQTRLLQFNQKLLGFDSNKSMISSIHSGAAAGMSGGLSGRRGLHQQQGQQQQGRVRAQSVDGAAQRQKQLEVFLSRIEQGQLRKERRMAEVKRSVTPSFHPEINKTTQQIFQQRYGNSDTTFIDRMERYLLRTQDNNQRNQILAIASEKECTYKPKLNKKSENLKSRSLYDLSFGDMIKKENSQRLLTLRVQQEEISQLTFQPELSNHAKSNKVHSTLRLQHNPGFHLEWIKSKEENKNKTRVLELQKRQQDELKDCTFQPSTIDCPDYIKRIAHSMAVIKTARTQSEKSNSIAVKPDWK